MSITLLV